MLILGIESSCDDMAAAVVRDGRYILSSIVSSQDAIHHKYGGIVPELASRRHLETIIPVVHEALGQADLTLSDIDGIGVTRGPGLVGSILVGVSFAKAISYVKGIPFVGVNHIEAHPMAVFLEGKRSEAKPPTSNLQPPTFPFIALVVSGGHTALFKFRGFGDYEILGQTRDDAAGEAFDKVAKLLGLGYPGGAVVDRLAKSGDAMAIEFKRPYISKDTFDFSFSGIKTAVLNYLNTLEITQKTMKNQLRGEAEAISKGQIPSCARNDGLETLISDLAASFQEAIVDVLVDKAISACKANAINSLIVSGGVACNSRLREKLSLASGDNGIGLCIPPPYLCSDNGAMIAVSAYHLLKRGVSDGFDMNAVPNL